jgi:integrase
MAKRGENIYKRKDGRWEGRYIKGKKPDGKPRYGYVYGGKYGDVKEKLLPLKLKHKGLPQDGENFRGLFRDYVSACFLSASEPVKESTLAGYRRILDNHILPAFGDKTLNRLKKEDLDMFADMLKEKKLSNGMRHNILRLLLHLLRKAVDSGSLDGEILKGFEVPSVDKSKVPVLNQREQAAIERAAAGNDRDAAVILALYTGMRVGEICALKWSDVDLEEGMIHVRRTVQRLENVKGKGPKTRLCFGPPKTLSSERIIPLSAKLHRYLKELKAHARGEYVIASKGTFAEPRVIQYRFHALLRKAGIRRINFHALRHTFAVRCMELHMDVTTLSQLLGHTSVKLTLDVYTDSLMEHKKAEVRLLDSLGMAEKVPA